MVAKRYPQTAYAGLVKSLQSEWQYLQRVVPDLGEEFKPIEQALREAFLPALLGDGLEVTARQRNLYALPVKQGGLGILNPTETGSRCYTSSVDATSMLSQSLVKGDDLAVGAYIAASKTAKQAHRKVRLKAVEDQLKLICAAESRVNVRRITRSKECGSWLTTMPDTLNGTDLEADEFRDALRLRYGLAPTNLPQQCEGCGAKFTVEHALSCKKGGMVLARHNDLKHEWHSLCSKALTPSHVSDEPLIFSSQDVRAAGDAGTEPRPELRGGH